MGCECGNRREEKRSKASHSPFSLVLFAKLATLTLFACHSIVSGASGKPQL